MRKYVSVLQLHRGLGSIRRLGMTQGRYRAERMTFVDSSSKKTQRAHWPVHSTTRLVGRMFCCDDDFFSSGTPCDWEE